MRKEIQFLLASVIILFPMIVLMDFTHMPELAIWLFVASWSTVVAIMYAVIWRESVNCTCLEKNIKKIGMVVDSSLTFEEAHEKAVKAVEE